MMKFFEVFFFFSLSINFARVALHGSLDLFFNNRRKKWGTINENKENCQIVSREELVFARFFKRLVARSNASPLAFPPFFAPRMKCVLLLYLGAKKKRKKKRAATSGVGGDDGGDEEVNEEEAEGGRVRRKRPLPPSCTLSAEKTTPAPRSRSRSSYRPFTNNKLNLLVDKCSIWRQN